MSSIKKTQILNPLTIGKFFIFHSSFFIFNYLGVPLRVGLSARHPQSHHLLVRICNPHQPQVVALWLTESASIPHAARPEVPPQCTKVTVSTKR